MSSSSPTRYLSLPLVILVIYLTTLTASLPQQNPNLRFSKLLSKKSDLLRFTSLAENPFGDNFQRVFTSKRQSGESVENESLDSRSGSGSRERELYNSNSHEKTNRRRKEPRVITSPEEGNEYVYIHQTIKSDSGEQRAALNKEEDGIVTQINQKPSRRANVALLRQNIGKRLNISPVFADVPQQQQQQQPQQQKQSRRRNPTYRERVSSSISSSELKQEGTTIKDRVYEESAEQTTTENYLNGDSEGTTFYPYPTENKSEEKSNTKMVINVVTSAPRIVFDNVTRPVRGEKKLPNKPESENLVISDSIHRSGQFPDFEDTPLSLAVAETNQQPARVNVRPAASGKDYEYEYIYYYYDEEEVPSNETKVYIKDETGSTISTSTTRSPLTLVTPTPSLTTTRLVENIKSNNIPDEAIDQTHYDTNFIEKTQILHHREPKTFQYEDSNSGPEYSEEEEEEIQHTTVFPADISRTSRPHPNSVNRPVLLKQSNLYETTSPIVVSPTPYSTTTTTTENNSRRQPSTTTVEYFQNEVPVSRAVPSRFRNNANANNVRNQFQQQNQEQIQPQIQQEIPLEPVRAPVRTRFSVNSLPSPSPTPVEIIDVIEYDDKNVYTDQNSVTRVTPVKDNSNSRRNPIHIRRPQSSRGVNVNPQFTQSSPSVVPPTPQYVQQQAVETLETRIPQRTRFPPRTTTFASIEPSEIPLPYPVDTVNKEIEIEKSNELKDRENFARQKSINDIYALSRLHQLAINTRVPNKKVEYDSSVLKTNINPVYTSAEQTTIRIPEEPEIVTVPAVYPASSELTTLPKVLSSPVAEVVEEIPSSAAAPVEETEPEQVKPGRFGRPGQRSRGFRNKSKPTESPTTEGSSSPSLRANPHRFSGSRRRNFGRSTTEKPVSDASPSPSSNQINSATSTAVDGEVDNSGKTTRSRIRPQARNNRFFTRGRTPSSTTESTNGNVNEAHEASNSETAANPSTRSPSPQPTPVRRRPNFQTRRRPINTPQQAVEESEVENQQHQQPQALAASVSTNETPQAPQQKAAAKDSSAKRRFNFGNSARNRSPAPPAGQPITNAKRFPSRIRVSEPEEEHIKEEEQTRQEEDEEEEKKEVAVKEEQQPIVQTSVSSTTSFSVEEIPKRGSAGVLGRLRNRAKTSATSTTQAPDLSKPEKKPSRISGILNRRKQQNNPAAPAVTPPSDNLPKFDEVHEEEIHDNEKGDDGHSRKEVIVQVSSTVTESEEVSEHQFLSEPSSTTQVSLLRRLKSNRKPGSLFKKRPEQNPE